MEEKPAFNVGLLELGKVYNFDMVGDFPNAKGKTEQRTAKLGHYLFETKTETWDGEVIYRFQSQFGNTLLFLNKDGKTIGDFSGWCITAFEESEPLFIKSVKMPEKELTEKASAEFGDDADKVIEFFKNLK